MAEKPARLAFTEAFKRLQKLGDDYPEFFDMANKVLRDVDSGEQLLLGALILGLREAYRMGKAREVVQQDPEMAAARALQKAEFKSSKQPVTEPQNAIDCKKEESNTARPRRTRTPATSPTPPPALARRTRTRR